MMVSLASLWLPILLSAVFVFIISSVIHMVFTYHQSDFGKVPKEDEVMDALRPFNIPEGDYVFPRAARAKDMKSEEYKEKVIKGPVAFFTMLKSGEQSMTGSLVQWFLYSILISIFSGYIASVALSPGASYLEVFRFAGTTAFAGYSLGLMQNSIWYKRKWSSTLKSMFDGLLYALFTAGTFGWLWPAA